MKYRKFNRYEKKANKSYNVANAMSGGGIYIYENSSKHADLTLPRPTKTGVRHVGPSGQFQGDDYYMQLVKTGMLRLVKVLQTAEEEKAALESQNNEEEEQILMEQKKLLVDQPDRVTQKGKIESVVAKNGTKQKLHETSNEPQPDVLLNEGPVSDGFLIIT